VDRNGINNIIRICCMTASFCIAFLFVLACSETTETNAHCAHPRCANNQSDADEKKQKLQHPVFPCGHPPKY
jgi:hypothetical protein